VTELQRYLAEEIAKDHADGLVSRLEALRRLGLLGLSGVTAASLLAGFVAPAFGTRSSLSRASTTRSSTQPDHGTTPLRPRAAYRRMLTWFGTHVAT
jgi:carboxymethylenebutenolidase